MCDKRLLDNQIPPFPNWSNINEFVWYIFTHLHCLSLNFYYGLFTFYPHRNNRKNGFECQSVFAVNFNSNSPHSDIVLQQEIVGGGYYDYCRLGLESLHGPLAIWKGGHNRIKSDNKKTKGALEIGKKRETVNSLPNNPYRAAELHLAGLQILCNTLFGTYGLAPGRFLKGSKTNGDT